MVLSLIGVSIVTAQHSFRTENLMKKNKDFCGIVMPPEKR